MENSLPGTPAHTDTPDAPPGEVGSAASRAERRRSVTRRSPRPGRAASRGIRWRASLRSGALPFLAAAFAPGCGTDSPAPPPPPPPPILENLEIAGPDSSKPLVPAFAPEIRHYAVRCAERETLSVTAAAAPANDIEPATLALNGAPLPDGRAEVSLRDDQDLAVEIRRGAASTTYAVHCVPLDLPEVEVVTVGPGPADGLLLLNLGYHGEEGKSVNYLTVLDDHGVPRFHRRVGGDVRNFRWHAAARRYSYHRHGVGGHGGYVDVLDERFELVARPYPVGYSAPDSHDFRITDEGHYLFIVYSPAERDFRAVPDRNGDFPYGRAEPTHDSVIQEVTPEGEVVFEWNSGEGRDGDGPPIRFEDCRVQTFPDHYAWLNSLSFTSEGNLLASFRGCAQVLEIERPSGRVLRQIGGSAPAIPDGRVHHRIVGDPYPVGFCGQHTPIETGRSADGDLRIAVFDNGVHCLGDEDRPRPHENHPSRVVEYRLSGEEAIFLRHYESLFSNHVAGSVQALDNGNWLITWGWGPPRVSPVEVDPSGREVFKMRVRGDAVAGIYRAYREPGLTIPLNLP